MNTGGGEIRRESAARTSCSNSGSLSRGKLGTSMVTAAHIQLPFATHRTDLRRAWGALIQEETIQPFVDTRVDFPLTVSW